MKKNIPNNQKGSILNGCLTFIVVIMIVIISVFALLFIYYNFFKETGKRESIEEKINRIHESHEIPPAPQDMLVEYYTNIAFNDNDAVTEKNTKVVDELSKWDKQEVKVELTGEYNQAISDMFDQFISDFNNVSTYTKLIRAENGGDIKITFQSHASLAKLISDPRLLSRPQYGWTRTDGGCRLKSAQIYLENDKMNFDDYLPGIKYVLGHEFFHALGFPGHDTGDKYCNYMAPIPCGPIKGFTEYDQFVIKISYASDLKACEKKAAVMKLFK